MGVARRRAPRQVRGGGGRSLARSRRAGVGGGGVPATSTLPQRGPSCCATSCRRRAPTARRACASAARPARDRADVGRQDHRHAPVLPRPAGERRAARPADGLGRSAPPVRDVHEGRDDVPGPLRPHRARLPGVPRRLPRPVLKVLRTLCFACSACARRRRSATRRARSTRRRASRRCTPRCAAGARARTAASAGRATRAATTASRRRGRPTRRRGGRTRRSASTARGPSRRARRSRSSSTPTRTTSRCWASGRTRRTRAG